MKNKSSCKEITSTIQALKSKRVLFDEAFAKNNFHDSIKLMHGIKRIIREAEAHIWSLEILTKENMEKQYDDWRELYKDLNPLYKLPSKERMFEFFQEDPVFIELMKTKETQGLTKMIVAPAPGFYLLQPFAYQVERKAKECGGSGNRYSHLWRQMFADESYIRYFGTIDSSDPALPTHEDGYTPEEIRSNPNKFGICDSWMISFTTDITNLTDVKEDDNRNGRAHIRPGLKPATYINKYFSNTSPSYAGEEIMIPEEYFALLLENLYTKYIKTDNKKITSYSEDILDSNSETLFIGTYLSNRPGIPNASWSSFNTKFVLHDSHILESEFYQGVRSVVRRNFKS